MVVNFFAAAVFSLMMCAFWWFIASHELVHAVKRKADMLYDTREKLMEDPVLRDLAIVLDTQINQAHMKVKQNVKHDEAYRTFQNRTLLFMRMGPIVSIYIGLLLATVMYNQTRTHYADDPHHLAFGHWWGLVLVLVSYVPEILFFLYVIEWLVPIGDYEVALRACGFRK